MDATVAAWRREQRARLIAERQAVTSEQRASATAIIESKLADVVAKLQPAIVGLYWPIRNEINLLRWGEALQTKHSVTLSLPVVVTPKAPLEYWRWTPDAPMKTGFWNIPVPAQRDVVLPDLMLAPLVGFDQANYRLGYGGGYFDRTLASRDPRPTVVGIGYELGALETIFPQPFDIPMNAILTERRDQNFPLPRSGGGGGDAAAHPQPRFIRVP